MNQIKILKILLSSIGVVSAQKLFGEIFISAIDARNKTKIKM
jgi:TfoX/Sxy family transcriptional regulator of competence genes